MPLSPNCVVISEFEVCYARSDVLSVRCPGGVHLMSTSPRQHLPNRRPSHSETLEVGGHTFTACVGFDPATGAPYELFLNGGKESSQVDALLSDVATIISIALQFGIPPTAFRKSVGRSPDLSTLPGSLDQLAAGSQPASAIGAPIDLLCSFGREPAE